MAGVHFDQPMQIVSDGYRKTEIGVLPKEWPVVTINEMACTGGGTTPPRSLQARYFTGGSHLWVKTTDLNNSFVIDTEDKVTDLALQETGLKKHPAGTVLVAMYGGFNQIGRTGVLNESSAINQALIGVLPNKRKFNSIYLLAVLNYKVDFWRQVASSSRKDPNITSSDVKAFRLPLPSIKEQAAIANALADVDSLLCSLEKLITKKQAVKTATMQQLLTGRTRLPQFAIHSDGRPKEAKQTELGRIPEDWEVYALSELLKGKPKYGINAPSVKKRGNLPSYIRITDISIDGRFNPAEVVAVDSPFSENYQVQRGDILLARTGASVGKAYLYKESDGALVYAGFLINISPAPERLSSQYLFQYFRTSVYADWVAVMSMRSGQPGINGNEYGGLRLPLPRLEEQIAIANILSDIDADIQSVEARLSKIRQIKQGMMQELLTGRTRLV